jgi:hypothetical protein
MGEGRRIKKVQSFNVSECQGFKFSAVVKIPFEPAEGLGCMGSFDCVRRAPHFAQDDNDGRVSGFEFGVSGFEFRVSGFEFRVSGFKLQSAFADCGFLIEDSTPGTDVQSTI